MCIGNRSKRRRAYKKYNYKKHQAELFMIELAKRMAREFERNVLLGNAEKNHGIKVSIQNFSFNRENDNE